jgi:hypothetical protein
MANDDDSKPGLIPKFVRGKTGPDDPEYGPYRPHNKGPDPMNPDIVGEYKNRSQPDRRRSFEIKAPPGVTPIPHDLLVQAIDLYKDSTIVLDMAVGSTLVQMLKIYERNIAVSENAFSRLYKDRPSTHEADIEERERVARDMHAERAQARDFLDYIKEGMQNRKLLSKYEIETFENIIHPSRSRRER